MSFSNIQTVIREGRLEFMRYFTMKTHGNVPLPITKKNEGEEVVLTSGLSRFSDIDYDVRCELISERLKQLMEMFMPKYNFVPVVYLDIHNKSQLVFFRFRPPFFEDCMASFGNDGTVSHITFAGANAPLVFTVRSPKGIRSIIVSMAVGESALRRKILGVEFNQVTDD